jgi:hypothetical protein
MNKAGAGVGTFTVQDPAYVPRERAVRGPGPLLGTLAAMVAGLVLAVVLVTAVHSARRPLFSLEQAARVARATPLGELRLPRGRLDPARHVPGRRPLAHRLLREGVTDLILDGSARSAAARRQLAAALSHAPELSGRVTARPAEVAPPPMEVGHRQVILVVEEGSPPRSLLTVRGDLPDDEVVGLVFVRWDRRRPLGGHRRRRGNRRPNTRARAGSVPQAGSAA